jgi:heme A synthase
VTADVSWVLALLTAAYALKAIRSSQPTPACCSAILFVITLAHTGIGHPITDNGDDGLVAIHIPLAFLIFGLAIWISGRALRLSSS